MLGGEFRGRVQIINLSFSLRNTEKEEKAEPKPSRRKEIIKITAESNGMEKQEKINESKSQIFKRKEMDQYLTSSVIGKL